MYCIDRDLLRGSYRSRAPIAKKKRRIRYATQSIMQESATGSTWLEFKSIIPIWLCGYLSWLRTWQQYSDTITWDLDVRDLGGGWERIWKIL